MAEETVQQPVVKPAATGNINAALTYVLGWITGLIFLLIEKEDRFIRFHAAQSVIVFGALNIILLVPFIGQIIGFFISPLAFILLVFLMYKAYNNEEYRLPFVGEYIERVEKAIGGKA